MSEINTFTFNRNGFEDIKNFPLGRDWPVVYIIENQQEVYIGETTSIYNRSRQHYENESRVNLERLHVITDEEYNKSATLDLESQLIQYFSAEGTLRLQNGNKGLVNHNYFDRDRYRAKLETVWNCLKELKLVKRELSDIENSELFKYSPYKALTEDQLAVAEELYEVVKTQKTSIHIVNGGPGTGKTILATYLVKLLKEDDKTKNLVVGLVISMTSLRKSIKDAFSCVSGLSADMVIGPSEVSNKKYDLLIVDEAHRLRQRRNLANYVRHDQMNQQFGLGKEGTELDWILKCSTQQILFYDENQSVRPTDVHVDRFKNLKATHHLLTSQLRVKGGEKYIEFVSNIFDGQKNIDTEFSNYDFKIYNDVKQMFADIIDKNSKFSLCRMVAGFAWPWVSRGKPNATDININGFKMKWNSTTTNWVNSPNAINEVGCIHTIQGYDLNYVGVIIGPELAYNAKNDCLVVDKSKYEDRNGWRGVTDPTELDRYIKNIYKTLMTRGMRGCYVYFVNKKVEQYFRDRIRNSISEIKEEITIKKNIPSPYVGLMINVPLFESVGCGELMHANIIPEEMIPVRKDHLSSGSKYFVLRVTGDSMNKAGINDGDLVLCVKNYQPENGKKVVALIGDDATIKEYYKEKDQIILKPCSTNSKHQPLKFNDDEIKIQGVVVRVLDREE